jgi:hypothetical protein
MPASGQSQPARRRLPDHTPPSPADPSSAGDLWGHAAPRGRCTTRGGEPGPFFRRSNMGLIEACIPVVGLHSQPKTKD